MKALSCDEKIAKYITYVDRKIQQKVLGQNNYNIFKSTDRGSASMLNSSDIQILESYKLILIKYGLLSSFSFSRLQQIPLARGFDNPIIDLISEINNITGNSLKEKCSSVSVEETLRIFGQRIILLVHIL